MEKQADLTQMVQALLDPAIRQWAGKRGLVVGDLHGQKHLLNVLRDAAYEKQLTEALYGAAQQDRPTWERLMQGLATLSGQQWTPEAAAHAKSLSGDFAQVAPYFMRWAPDVWDKLHGSKGSVASLTHAIAEANRNNPDFSVPQAHQLASQVFEQLYGANDPMRHRGFGAADMGRIYGEAFRRGLIAPGTDPAAMAKSLQAVTGPVSAIRDNLQAQGVTEMPMSGMFDVYDRLQQGAPQLSPAQLELQLRQQTQLQQTGAPTHFNQALRQQGGLQGSGSNIAELTALDTQLTQQAAGSQLGNMVAATHRLSQLVGFKPGTPAAQLLSQAQQGTLPKMSAGQWTQVMRQSGVASDIAARILSDTQGNQQYMTPELMAATRRNQFTVDWQPWIAQLPANTGIRRQLDTDQMARSRGYRDWQQVSQLHGSAADQAWQLMQRSQQQAEADRQFSPYGRTGMLPRTIDAIRNATPETTTRDILQRGVLNMVPQQELPQMPVP